MKKIFLAALFTLGTLAAFAANGQSGQDGQQQTKPKLMWLDCSANFERFSYPDSIAYYVDKCHRAGITALVLDLKGTSGEVNYDSRFAPRRRTARGFTRQDFPFIETFVVQAHSRGMKIYGSFNVFAETLAIRGDHPEWQTMSYIPGRGIVPTSEDEDKLVLFTNPALPEVQQHQIDIFKEVAAGFDLDGLILDRGRYDNIYSDFSEFSRRTFEKYAKVKLKRFPEDIYEWTKDDGGEWKMKRGPHFKKWIEWRASVIHDFMVRARREIKSVNPHIGFGVYTGAWYPSYYEVGVNWASRDYDPSTEFDWATAEYKNYAFAELLDIYTNGNYYWNVSLEEHRRGKGAHRNETDSNIQQGDHLCVEGACIYSRHLLRGNKFLGGMYVEDYKTDTLQFKRAVEMNLRRSDGLMVFDIVHIINRGWWGPLERAIRDGEECAAPIRP